MPSQIYNNILNGLFPFAGVLAALVSLITGFFGGLGANTESSLAKPAHNIVFHVTDQHGSPRHCLVRPGVPGIHPDNAVYTEPDGTFTLSAEAGETVSVIFDCEPTSRGAQRGKASVIAPENGVVHQTVVVPKPGTKAGLSS